MQEFNIGDSRLDTAGRKGVFLASISLLLLAIVLPLPVWLGGLLTLSGAVLAIGLVWHVARSPLPPKRRAA